jgi:hypothetical protein
MDLLLKINGFISYADEELFKSHTRIVQIEVER